MDRPRTTGRRSAGLPPLRDRARRSLRARSPQHRAPRPLLGALQFRSRRGVTVAGAR